MNIAHFALVSSVVAIVAGCTAPSPQTAAAPAPAPRIEFHIQPYAQAAPSPGDDAPQFCRLGSDCMQLDPRPFKPCLTRGEPCEGAGEFMKVAPDVVIKSIKPDVIGPMPDLPPKK